MNLDFLDVLSQPDQKPVGTMGTVGTANNDAGFRVPKAIFQVGTVGTDNVAGVPTVPNPKFSMGTENLNKDAGVPVVPTVPTENINSANKNRSEPKYDGTCWFVRGQLVTVFPHCTACCSYFLLREADGTYTCQSCEFGGIEESAARRVM